MTADRPEAPVYLADAGRGLWARMHERLAAGTRFSVHESEVLARACAAADRESGLREFLDRDGLLSVGSKGQLTLHPALGELRLLESQVTGLLTRLSTENTGGVVQTTSSQRAKNAAEARWKGARDELAARREAAGIDG
jgi:hypothetical protein